jgi:MFS family permease
MRDVYPPKVVPFATSLSRTGIGVLAAIVPFVIGALLDNYGYRAIFLFHVVWIVVAGTAVVLLTPETPLRLRTKLDLLGTFLLATGTAGILLAISLGSGEAGWTSPVVIILIVLGIALLATYVPLSRRRENAIVNLKTFTRKPVLFAALGQGMVVGFAPVALILLAILAMTSGKAHAGYGLGVTASTYAWVSFAYAVAQVLAGLGVGLVVRRTSARKTMHAALLFMAAAFVYLAFQHDHLAQLIVASTCVGLGGGSALASTPHLVIASTPAAEQGAISASVETCTHIASSISPVITYAIISGGVATAAGSGALLYSPTGIKTALFVAAALSVLAMLVGVLFLRPRRSVAAPCADPIRGSDDPEPTESVKAN